MHQLATEIEPAKTKDILIDARKQEVKRAACGEPAEILALVSQVKLVRGVLAHFLNGAAVFKLLKRTRPSSQGGR